MHPSVNPAYPGCHNQRSIKAPLFKTVRVAKPRTSPLQAERFSAESRHRSLRTIAGSSDKDVSAKRQPELRMLSGARGLRVLEFITRLGAGQVEIPQLAAVWQICMYQQDLLKMRPQHWCCGEVAGTSTVKDWHPSKLVSLCLA